MCLTSIKSKNPEPTEGIGYRIMSLDLINDRRFLKSYYWVTNKRYKTRAWLDEKDYRSRIDKKEKAIFINNVDHQLIYSYPFGFHFFFDFDVLKRYTYWQNFEDFVIKGTVVEGVAKPKSAIVKIKYKGLHTIGLQSFAVVGVAKFIKILKIIEVGW